MKIYSVTATLAATADLAPLRRYTDLVPGTLLLEDPEGPSLVFPVEAASAAEAVQFVYGVAVVGDLDLVSGHVEELDDDDDPAGSAEGDATATAAERWRDELLVSS